MTKQFIMETLGIQKNDHRDLLLNVLNINDGGAQINEGQLFRITESNSINSEFLQPLVNHLLAYPSDERNESIVTFLHFTIVIQRNAAGTIDPDLLIQNPRNKLSIIEQQLFDYLTIKLRSEDPALVEKNVDVVYGLVNSIGIEVPQAILAQMMINTIRHCTSEDATELASKELLIIGVAIANALSISTNYNIRYNADVAIFHRFLITLEADQLYKPQVLASLEQLRIRTSVLTLIARMGASLNRANQGQEPTSSSRPNMF